MFRSITVLRLERKVLRRPVLHLRHFKLGGFEDPTVDTCQGIFPAPYSTPLDLTVALFNHGSPRGDEPRSTVMVL